MSIRLAAPLAALALCACSTPRVGTMPASRAPFTPSRADAVLLGAVRVLQERGHRIEACDNGVYALASGAVENDVPCYLGRCLGRQMATVKLGYRTVRVRLVRQVWDYTAKDWVTVRDDGVEREEEALLREVLSASETQRLGSDPCAILYASAGSNEG